jgi:hypothetical protein
MGGFSHTNPHPVIDGKEYTCRCTEDRTCRGCIEQDRWRAKVYRDRGVEQLERRVEEAAQRLRAAEDALRTARQITCSCRMCTPCDCWRCAPVPPEKTPRAGADKPSGGPTRRSGRTR